ncbi:MAG: tape measure protein [Sterolibacterium sp.]|nr:tape measure protein [Sterolibacterium sp.]
MAQDINLGIRLKFDGKEVEGGLTISREHLRKFASDAQRACDSAAGGFSSAAKGVRSVSQQLEALQSMAARGAGLIALAVSAKEMASALIDARLAADKLKNSLEFSTGGMAGAAREIEYLRTVTRTMGLDFATASQAYAKFAASARGAGMSLADTRATFEGVSAAGARFGLSADEMGGAFLALGQMASKGVVSMEELRGQLGERLPGAFSIAANAMGVTQAELIKMVESGKLASADFLPRFAQALKEIEAPLGSLQQELNRTKSAWDLWKQDLVAGGGGSGFLSHFTDSINDSSAAMRRLGDDTNVVIKYMAAVKAFEFKFLTGKSLFDPQQLQGQKRQEVHELQKVQDALELSASKNSGYLSPLNRSQLNDTIGRIKELRIELAGLAMQRGKEVGFQASDIKGDFERRRAAENARLKAYGEDTKYASKAVKIAKDVEEENKLFSTAVLGLQETDARYIQALKDHNARVAEIRSKGADKGDAREGVAEVQAKKQIEVLRRAAQEELSALEVGHAAGLVEEQDYQEQRLGIRQQALKAQLSIAQQYAEAERDPKKHEAALARVTLLTSDLSIAANEAAKSLAAMGKAGRDSILKGADEENRRLVDTIQKREEELQLLGLSEEQKDRNRAATLRAAAAENELNASVYEQAAAFFACQKDGEAQVRLYEELAGKARILADNQNRLARVDDQVAAREAGIKAAKDATEAWQKFSDDIERSLTDYLKGLV